MCLGEPNAVLRTAHWYLADSALADEDKDRGLPQNGRSAVEKGVDMYLVAVAATDVAFDI